MSKRLTSTIAGAFIFITIINILSRGLGFFREMLFANYFGMGHTFDIYLVGAVIPLTINVIMLYFAQNYFIPAYNKVKTSDSYQPGEFFNNVLNLFALGSIILSILLYLFSESIVGLYLHTSNSVSYKIALDIFKIFLITIPLNSVISVIIAYNQAEFEFKFPAISRLLLNLMIIVVLFFFTRKLGIYVIPIGFITGSALQLIYLFLKINLRVKPSLSFIFKKKLDKSIFDFTIVNILVIETISQMYLLVDRYFFTEVNEGGISALNYSMILYVLPVSMISIALATVIFPKFSANIQNKKFDELNKNVIDAIRANLFIFVPVTFFFLLYGNDLIRLLFERGKFTAQDSQIAFNVLKYYAVSLIFYSAYSIYNKIIYSTSLIYALLMITLGGIIIKIILNFLLVHSYQQNGLAFSTSVSYIFLFLLSMLLIYHKIPGIKQSVFFKELVFYLFNGIICFFIVEILFSGILRIYILQDLFKMVIFYAFFLLNLKLANHGSIQLAGSIIRNLRDVRSI